MKLWDKVKKGAEGAANLAKKAGKVVTGVKAYHDRKEAKHLCSEADTLQEETLREDEWRKDIANQELEEFGSVRLGALQSTVKVFLGYLKIMKYNYNEKTYHLGGSVSLTTNDIDSLKRIDMNASEALSATAAAGTAAAAAIQGVPSAVTYLVGRYALASTGTAIAKLHGAAATNAIMAWLGGGSLASGGGGMAAGAAVLEGIVGVSTGIVALASLGIVASVHYSKKLTAAQEYHSQVLVNREKAEAAWDLMDRILERADELKEVTLALEERIIDQLEYMEPLIYDFNTTDPYYVETFKQTALMVKSMSEISQVPIINEKGYVSEESRLQIQQVNTILNREL